MSRCCELQLPKPNGKSSCRNNREGVRNTKDTLTDQETTSGTTTKRHKTNTHTYSNEYNATENNYIEKQRHRSTTGRRGNTTEGSSGWRMALMWCAGYRYLQLPVVMSVTTQIHDYWRWPGVEMVVSFYLFKLDFFWWALCYVDENKLEKDFLKKGACANGCNFFRTITFQYNVDVWLGENVEITSVFMHKQAMRPSGAQRTAW